MSKRPEFAMSPHPILAHVMGRSSSLPQIPPATEMDEVKTEIASVKAGTAGGLYAQMSVEQKIQQLHDLNQQLLELQKKENLLLQQQSGAHHP